MADRSVYASKAVSQIPRLLSLQDRNPLSPTYGCFHRDYWLDKTSDFPDAVRQFAVHALALVYRHDFPGSVYRGQAKIRDWAIAGLDFWGRIQHEDGSFDEFYPYERGWCGPTAFTTYTAVEAFRLLQGEVPAEIAARVTAAIRRAARFIAAGESEEDALANHHAMASLAVWKAYELLGDADLKKGFQRLWLGFLQYHRAEEGWSREYDGVDPGYLSATVSFLAKIYQGNPDPEILQVLRQSIEFCSYCVYPDGFFGGSLGSRNTVHFYPHGFEVMAPQVPLAAAVAEAMLAGLEEGKLVPPDLISDRYVVYRVPEFLQAYMDYAARPAELPHLPYDRAPFTRYFPGARLFVAARPGHYVVANLAKGGVIKVYDRRNRELLLHDAGLNCRLGDGRVVTSQWVDPAYACRADETGWEVGGQLHCVQSTKLFTPLRTILFRGALLALGWSPRLSHVLKGRIRRALMLGRRPVPLRFRRWLRLEDDAVTLTDEIEVEGDARLAALSVGDEFFVRYVPQSRYFQGYELATRGQTLDEGVLEAVNAGQRLRLRRVIAGGGGGTLGVHIEVAGDAHGRGSLPKGVYGADYFVGRQRSRQLMYRLRRRTDEVEGALRRYGNGCLRVVVDVGTADGLMLEELRRRLGALTFLGLDLSFPLLSAHPAEGVSKVQAEALCLPLRAGSADAVIATAVIEHVSSPRIMLEECSRILRPGGLLVLTTPDPRMERLASAIGLLKETGHQYTLDRRQLRESAEGAGLRVLEVRKFMFSPVGFPAERTIERALRSVGLSLLLANQLMVARK